MSNIKQRVRDIIADKLGTSMEEIVEQATFEQLGADSLDSVEIVMEFEKEFQIAIPDNEMETIRDVGHAIEMITKKVAEKENPPSGL